MQPSSAFVKIPEDFVKNLEARQKTALVLKNSAAVLKNSAAVLKKTAAVFCAYLCKKVFLSPSVSPSAIRQPVNG